MVRKESPDEENTVAVSNGADLDRNGSFGAPVGTGDDGEGTTNGAPGRVKPPRPGLRRRQMMENSLRMLGVTMENSLSTLGVTMENSLRTLGVTGNGRSASGLARISSRSMLTGTGRPDSKTLVSSTSFVSTRTRWSRLDWEKNEEGKGGLIPIRMVSDAEKLEVGTRVRDTKLVRSGKVIGDAGGSKKSFDILFGGTEGAVETFSAAAVKSRLNIDAETLDIGTWVRDTKLDLSGKVIGDAGGRKQFFDICFGGEEGVVETFSAVDVTSRFYIVGKVYAKKDVSKPSWSPQDWTNQTELIPVRAVSDPEEIELDVGTQIRDTKMGRSGRVIGDSGGSKKSFDILFGGTKGAVETFSAVEVTSRFEVDAEKLNVGTWVRDTNLGLSGKVIGDAGGRRQFFDIRFGGEGGVVEKFSAPDVTPRFFIIDASKPSWSPQDWINQAELIPIRPVSDAEELEVDVGTWVRDTKLGRSGRVIGDAGGSKKFFDIRFVDEEGVFETFSAADVTPRFYIVREKDVSNPSWSPQDRTNRAEVTRDRWISICGSNLLIAAIYIVVFLIPGLFVDFFVGWRSAIITSVFIVLQIPVTVIQAIPDVDSSNEDVNKRVNATILVAMTLYPCLGLWILNRTAEDVSLWDIINMEIIWKSTNPAGSYQWGYIFPFLLWFTSACLLLRDSNYAFTIDRKGVVSDAKDEEKAVTALFRRNPGFVEVWTHKVTRKLTFSLWTLLPDDYRPAGKGGRFAFQLVSPVVFMFLWVGFRFIAFSVQEIAHIVRNRADFTRASDKMEESKENARNVALVRVVVWSVFTFYCIVIRSTIGCRCFLKWAVPDKQSFKHRWKDWSKTIVITKRSRVLWAFRGLANAAVPYYVLTLDTAGVRQFNALDGVLWYLYICVYVSFLMEGIGAIWFGLVEAERNCHLLTPFELFTDLSFWGAFNVYLQPPGTLINVIVYWANNERAKEIALREIWSPLLLNSRNQWRNIWLTLPIPVERLLKKRKQDPLPSEQKLNKRLKEWVKTWARKRKDAGRDPKNFVKVRPQEKPPPFDGQLVFHGTMFPSREEWLYMRNRYDEYIHLLPWDRPCGPEKFLQWYPSYREKIMALLREPYDFDVRHEIWMFGYGSLISPEIPPSGLTETQKKLIIPYWLKKQAGYRRTWNYRHGPCGMNAFGLEQMEDKTKGMNICGCVYPMDYEKASDLFSFREEGYELLFIHEQYFEPMHADFVLPKGIGYLWVCGQPTLLCGTSKNDTCANIRCKRHTPTQDSPILQSYIDLVLEGALRFNTAGQGHVDGMNFAAAILESTVGWKKPWYNDRQLAGRPWYLTPKYELIDGLLGTCPTSRDAFVDRLRTSMEKLSEKHQMLEKEEKVTANWSANFYGTNKAADLGIQGDCLSTIASETSE